ncbi:ComE operon protein 3 [bioreactor metagenome]|uniref:ComE operon protein 3 n=1 Tax=bioreactor metagenome TaxID=1076179 RepID=A0A645CR13_9ZZZZ
MGQGDAALVSTDDGKYILIDCGPEENRSSLLAFLRINGIKKLDMLILTHPHSDHIGSAARIVKEFVPDKILITSRTEKTPEYEELIDAFNSTEGISVETAVTGREYIVGSAVIRILYSRAAYDQNREDANNDSIVTKITLSGKSFLFMADAETETEKEICGMFPASELKADVIKIGHHGSDSSTSEQLIDIVSPEFAVISVGEDNGFGHPSESVTERLKERGIKIYRTDISGTVRFKFTNDALATYITRVADK